MNPSSKSLTVKSARQLLLVPGPITPERLRAAEFVQQLRLAEPAWKRWLISDTLFALTVLCASYDSARIVVLVYAALYLVSMVRKSKQALRLLLDAGSADGEPRDLSVLRAAQLVTYVVFALTALGAYMLPSLLLRVAAGLLTVVTLRRLVRVPRLHRIADRVSADAVTEVWHGRYAAARDQQSAAVRDLLESS